jgi:hypothetical protein
VNEVFALTESTMLEPCIPFDQTTVLSHPVAVNLTGSPAQTLASLCVKERVCAVRLNEEIRNNNRK